MIQSLTNIVNDRGIPNYADGTVAALPERSENLKQNRKRSHVVGNVVEPAFQFNILF